jgi:hypothetical protein
LIEGLIKEKAGVKDNGPVEDQSGDKQEDSGDDLEKALEDAGRKLLDDLFK